MFRLKLKSGFALFLSATAVFFSLFITSAITCGMYEHMDFMAWLYYIMAATGHAALFAFILFIPFFVLPAFLFRKNSVATIMYIVVSIVTGTLILTDGFVFDLYKFHINGFVLELVFGPGAGQIFEFDSKLVFEFIGIVLLFIVLPILVLAYISSRFIDRLKGRTITFISCFLIICIVFSHLCYAAASAMNKAEIQKSATVLPLFYPLTANSLMKRLGLKSADRFDNLVYNKTTSDIEFPLKPILSDDPTTKYNIVYLVLDSWNPSTFNDSVTPNMYKFATEKSQYFSNHNSSNYATRASIFSLFFGLSYTYGNEFYISQMSPLLIDRMLELNYDIEAFPSATLISPPFNEMIFRRIPGLTTQTEGNSSFERDINLTKNFDKFIDNRKPDDKPFFSFLFYDLPHAINIPAEHQKQFQPSWEHPNYLELKNNMDRTPFFNLYKNCVYYDDMLVGQVLDKLKEKGLLENTIIIITGDHGQEFNENKKNYWGHGSNFSKWQIQIPLIVYYPGIEAGKTVDHMTTHYDIAPTLLNRFLGIKNPSEDFSMGYDLWNDTTRYPHIVGDHVRYGFIMPRMILETGHLGTIDVTTRDLNPISKDSIDAGMLMQAISMKNKFYKK